MAIESDFATTPLLLGRLHIREKNSPNKDVFVSVRKKEEQTFTSAEKAFKQQQVAVPPKTSEKTWKRAQILNLQLFPEQAGGVIPSVQHFKASTVEQSPELKAGAIKQMMSDKRKGRNMKL